MSSASGKGILIKKAIREITALKEYDDYGDVDNREIFDHMKDNRMGVRWISKLSIKVIRSKLPIQYKER